MSRHARSPVARTKVRSARSEAQAESLHLLGRVPRNERRIIERFLNEIAAAAILAGNGN